MANVIVWGTGRWYETYKSNLELPGIVIKCLVDKQKEKHGTFIDGYEIKDPNVIVGQDVSIIIAIKKYEEVLKELQDIGFQGKVYIINDFVSEYIKDNRDEIRNILYPQKKVQKRKVIFDIIGGLGWAGTEIWAYNAVSILQKRNYEVEVWGDIYQRQLEKKYENLTYRFDTKTHFINKFLYKIAEKLPCCFFSNFWGKGQEYAFIAKQVFGDELKIVQVIHCDLHDIYNRLEGVIKYIDKFICVSEKLEKKCKKLCTGKEYKISSKLMGYSLCEKEIKKYSLDEKQPIQIGWAGRLVKEQKNADLLLDLIDKLEHRVEKYVLNIAGDGKYYSLLQQYINQKGLQNKVYMKGLLTPQEMNHFWEEQDIFLSISSYEGCSLSMLEAMSKGCVPVVTNVSGVSDVVENEVNGIIAEVIDLDVLVQGISRLEKERVLLQEYGEKSKEQIRVKCNEEGFAKYLEEIVEK